MTNEVNAGLQNANGAVPIIFSKKLGLSYKQGSRATFDNLTNNFWAGEIKNEGDRVRIVIPDGDAVNIDETGSDACPVLQATAPEALDLVIDKTQKYALAISDKQKAQTQFKNWLEAQANATAQKMLDSKNAQVIRLALEYTQPVDVTAATNTTVGAGGTIYTGSKHKLASDYEQANEFGTDAAPMIVTPQNVYQFLVRVQERLFDIGAIAEDGTYSFKPLEEEAQDKRAVFICGPRFASIIKCAYQVAGKATEKADMVMENGVIKRVAGLDIVVDRQIEKIVTTAANGASVGSPLAVTNLPFLAGTKNAITYASQLELTEHIRDPYCFQDIIRGMNLYGMKVVHPEALLRGFAEKLAFEDFDANIPVSGDVLVVNSTTNPVNTKEVPGA